MSPILIFAVSVVHLALLSYTIGIIAEQRSRRVTAIALRFLRIGVALDIVATTAMVIGSGSGLTLHGVLGFSALAAMLVETGLAWRHQSQNGDDLVPDWLHGYSRLAYGWWVVAYAAGAALVMRGAA